MNLILKYDDYLKRVYPTKALVTFDDDKKSQLMLTKDKQIKQQFTGGKKYKNQTEDNTYSNEINKSKNGDNQIRNKPMNDEFEIKYIENNNNAFILTGGGDPEEDHKKFIDNFIKLSKAKSSSKKNINGNNINRKDNALQYNAESNTNIIEEEKNIQPKFSQSGTLGLNRKKLENIKPSEEVKNGQNIIYIACVNDDRSKNSLMSSLKAKYKKEIADDIISVVPSLKMVKEGPKIVIVIDRNYAFNNNKLKLEDPKTDNLFYIPNDSNNFDFAKPIFMSNNSYVYDHLKPINYFDRKNSKDIKAHNDSFLNTYLDSKVTQLQNLYEHKNYIKLGKMNKELYTKIDDLLSSLPTKKITGGYEDYYSEDYYPEDYYRYEETNFH